MMAIREADKGRPSAADTPARPPASEAALVLGGVIVLHRSPRGGQVVDGVRHERREMGEATHVVPVPGLGILWHSLSKKQD